MVTSAIIQGSLNNVTMKFVITTVGHSWPRHLLILFLVCDCVFGVPGCTPKRSVYRIRDVTATNVLDLPSRSFKSLPSGVSLHITGRLNGTAVVYAAGWQPVELSGAVDQRIYHDWFQTNCLLHYNPLSVRSGELTVEYVFH
jgi:hypothetical protein